MRWLATAAFVVLAMGVEGSLGSTEEDLNRLAADLQSANRLTRVEAARSLAGRPSLPESLAEPAIDYIRSEVAHLETTEAGPEGLATGTATVPDDPDAVTFARIKARPETFIGARFILVGRIGLGNYYGYGYATLAKDYYSLTYRSVGREGATGDRGRLYLAKFNGRPLVERIKKAEVGNEPGELLARLQCTIDPERCGKPEDATSSILVTDWQLLARDGKSWTPWVYEGLNLGYDVLFRTGTQVPGKCVELITSEQVFLNDTADKRLRAWTILRILGLPRSQRDRILRDLPRHTSRSTSARAKVWAARAYNSLIVRRLVL